METNGGPPGTKKVETEASSAKAAKQALAAVIDSKPKKKAKERKDDITIKELARKAAEAGAEAGAEVRISMSEEKPKLTKAERKAAKQRAIASAAPGIVKALQDEGTATTSAVVKATKKHTANAIQSATEAFIDGPVAMVCNAFVALFLSSRNPAGDSDEAVAALDACRVAFDVCGLILSDVETKAAPKVNVEQPKPKKVKKQKMTVADTGEAQEANAAKKK